MPTAKSPEVWAFWRYDLFPYLLCGKVDTSKPPHRKPNMHYVPTYQSYMRPAFLLFGDDGKKMADRLEALRAEADAAHQNVRMEFNDKRLALFAEFGVTAP